MRLLGSGGLGEVYEVTDQALGGPVALRWPSWAPTPSRLHVLRAERLFVEDLGTICSAPSDGVMSTLRVERLVFVTGRA